MPTNKTIGITLFNSKSAFCKAVAKWSNARSRFGISVFFVVWLLGFQGVEAQNYGLQFNGVNQYAHATITGSTSTAMTLELWVKPTGNTGYSQSLAEVHSIGGSNQRYVQVLYTGSQFQVTCNPYTTSSALSTITFYAGNVLNKWYHLAVTIQNNSMIFYLNGSQVGSVTLTSNYALTGNEILILGADYDTYLGYSSYHRANAQIDEVRFFHGLAFSSGNMYKEIDPNTANLRAYYQMTDGSGTNLNDDRTGGAFDGTLVNGVSWVPNGAFPVNAFKNGSYLYCTSNIATAYNIVVNYSITGDLDFKINDNIEELTYFQWLPAWYNSIHIYPTTSDLTITSDMTPASFDFYGADHITIDGRVNAKGDVASLTLKNTHPNASVVRFIGDATYNTIQYCKIKGNSQSATSGLIHFSTTTKTTGNDYNTLDHNEITKDQYRSINAIYSSGGTSQSNDNNTISNNSFYNILATSTVNNTTPSSAILLADYNSNWTISGNSFYETETYNTTTAFDISMIKISSNSPGSGFVIDNNFIGGKLPECGGGAFAKTGNNNSFYGIRIKAADSPVSQVTGNTLSNMNWTNSGAAVWNGITVESGGVMVKENQIGAPTGNDSLLFTGGAANSEFYGISIAGSDTARCTNNTIGAITTNTTNSEMNANFYGINSYGIPATITGNLIGSLSTESSINTMSSSTSYAQYVYGIKVGGGVGTTLIDSNTVANILNSGTNKNSSITGISQGGSASEIVNNTIRNLISSNSGPSGMVSSAIKGISASGSGVSLLIRGNKIYNISNNNSSFTGSMVGIWNGVYNNSNANLVSQNFIHSISTWPTSSGASVYGIRINSGNTVYTNNIVSLGSVAPANIYGIAETSVSSYDYNKLYFNTVSINGSPTGSGATSYALNSDGTLGNKDFRNNIFSNQRNSMSESDKNYAIYLNYSDSSMLTLDYNNYYVSGTGGTIGYFAGAAYSALPSIGNDENSLIGNPDFIASASIVEEDYKNTAGLGESIATITTDYFGSTREETPIMGAVEVFERWTGQSNSTWDYTGNWQNGIVGSGNVLIPTGVLHTPEIIATAEVKNLIIKSNALLSVACSGSIRVTKTAKNNNGTIGLYLHSDPTGSASAIVNNRGVMATVERYIGGYTDDYHGWHFLSSPVGTFAINGSNFAPGVDDDFYSWSEATNQWLNFDHGFPTHMESGAGYLIARKTTATPFFMGALNSKDISVGNLASTSSSYYHGWHLLGNPFSSAIKWNDGNWNLTNISAVCQIWQESTASYTLIESMETIPSGNGFMVYTTGNGSLTIPASSRQMTGSNWYKDQNLQNNSITLKAIDAAGNTSQETIIRFNDDATNQFDLSFDSYFIAGFAPQFYSLSEGENYALNTLPELTDDLDIPLGFVKNGSTEFSIKLKENIPGLQVYLTDNKLNTTHSLHMSDYHFSSAPTDNPERFSLHFGAVGVDSQESETACKAYIANNRLILTQPLDETQIEIFDMAGRLVCRQQAKKGDYFSRQLHFTTGYYMVHLKNSKLSKSVKIFLS